jgi:hypothetical protein
MEMVCDGGKRILAQTHNVVEKYWGKGGILKWAEFLCFHDSFWNGTPTPSFIIQNIVIRLGDRLWAVKWLGNGLKTCTPLQFYIFRSFCECTRVVVVKQACLCGNY